MPYKGSNREYLNHLDIYNLLMEINENIDIETCVLACLEIDDKQRCKKFLSCSDCISEWLNEKRETK